LVLGDVATAPRQGHTTAIPSPQRRLCGDPGESRFRITNAARGDPRGGAHRHDGLLAVLVTFGVFAGLLVLGATDLDVHTVGHALGRVNGAWIVLALAYGLALQAAEVFDALVLGIPALLREGLPWTELRRRAQGCLAEEQ
jgi:hypothetical protein